MNSSVGSSDILSFMSTENSAASQEEMLASDDSVSLMSTATPNEEEFLQSLMESEREFLNQTTGASTLDVDQVMQEYYGNHSEDVTSTGSSVSHLY